MSDVHFKSQTSTVQCFRFTEIVCTLLFSFYLWRQVEIKISKMIWLRQAARASKTSFLFAEKRALFTPITHCFRFAIVKLKWTFSVQWIRKLLISETVIVCCSAKKWLTLNISNCIRPPLVQSNRSPYTSMEAVTVPYISFGHKNTDMSW